jgi:hypothetical protein
MNPDDLVHAACPPIAKLGSAFYFQPETLAKGKEHGIDGFRFYMLGRGGVLGDVESPVIASAFGYFHPAMIERLWTSARQKMSPRDAGRLYLECCRDFGRSRLSEIPDLDAFCAAADAINTAADPAGLALYAGVSSEPLPDDLPARAMQLITVLREFRGSAHLAAVIASGVAPRVAHYLKRPNDYATFGWGDEPPVVTDEDRANYESAEALTDRMVRSAYSAVDESGANALVAGLTAIAPALA